MGCLGPDVLSPSLVGEFGPGPEYGEAHLAYAGRSGNLASLVEC